MLYKTNTKLVSTSKRNEDLKLRSIFEKNDDNSQFTKPKETKFTKVVTKTQTIYGSVKSGGEDVDQIPGESKVKTAETSSRAFKLMMGIQTTPRKDEDDVRKDKEEARKDGEDARKDKEDAKEVVDYAEYATDGKGAEYLVKDNVEKVKEVWNYLRINSLLSQLNEALYLYANRLSKKIIKGKMYQSRLDDCSTKYKNLLSEYKGNVQDKIKFQEQLDDLSSKYSAIEQMLAKVKDMNEDNRHMINKLRANRDQCLQDGTNKMNTIYSLRNQAVVLRRKLSLFGKRQ